MKCDKFEKRDSLGKVIFIYAVLVLLAITSVYPLLDVLKISLRPKAGLFSSDLSLIPKNATFANYYTALFVRPYFLWFRNSLIVAVSSSVLSVGIAVTAAYGFARFKFRGRNTGLVAFLLTQIFPAPMLLLPTYILLRTFKFINTYHGSIIPYIALAVPFSVWVLKGYFDTLSMSIEESAFIDGANLFQVLTKIVIPLSLPAIGVVTLNSFMATWNEFIIAAIVFTETEMHTLPVALFSMTGAMSADWGIFSAACVVTALPVVIFFILMSKVMVNGLTLGGVKE